MSLAVNKLVTTVGIVVYTYVTILHYDSFRTTQMKAHKLWS